MFWLFFQIIYSTLADVFARQDEHTPESHLHSMSIRFSGDQSAK